MTPNILREVFEKHRCPNDATIKCKLYLSEIPHRYRPCPVFLDELCAAWPTPDRAKLEKILCNYQWLPTCGSALGGSMQVTMQSLSEKLLLWATGQPTTPHQRPASQGGAVMSNLTTRRAEFVYNAARLAAIAANAPVIPALWQDREESFQKQFLKVIERQCGDQRSASPEELHGSWMQAYFAMGWVYGTTYHHEQKTHPDLVPYAQLGQLERDKDAVFVALCEIARQWIYDA